MSLGVDEEVTVAQSGTQTRESDTGRSHARLVLSTLLIAALVRASTWKRVFTDEGVILRDGDCYAHMWRIWNLASKSTPLSARDPYVNFPDGGEVLWPPAFDWSIAQSITLLGLDRAGAEAFGAWIPVGLGASAVALAAWITARTFSTRAGWICGVMLALLPGSFVYTRIGYLDHHAAIALIGTAMLGGTMHIVSSGEVGPRRWPIWVGLVSALALSIWAGALLHIGVLQVAMLAWAVGCESGPAARTRTLGLAAAHAITAIAILPLSLQEWQHFGDFSPLALTRFQPTWYAAAAICLFATTLLWRSPLFGATRPMRFVAAALTGLIGLVIAFLMIPELTSTLDRSASWFTDDVVFLTNIKELSPLFAGKTAAYWQRPTLFLSPLLFVLPLAMITIGWRTDRLDVRVLLLWTAAFGALTLSQFRFINTFSIVHSMVSAAALAAIFDWITQRSRSAGKRVVATAGFAALLALTLVVVPVSAYYLPQLEAYDRAPANARRGLAMRELARWLAAERPVPLDVEGNPTTGLLTSWSSGHEIRYYSGWAMNQDGFGSYVSPENHERASRYFRSVDEDAAIVFLDEMKTQHVIADSVGAGFPPYPVDSLARRLVTAAGSGARFTRDGSEAREWAPALTRHRLLYARSNRRGGAWLYEIVPGAVISGRATPDSTVSIMLRLGTPSGLPRTWVDRQRTDATGEFRLRVPYSTVDAPESGFIPTGPYLLRTDRGEVEVDVSEHAIQAASTLSAPAIPDMNTNGEP